ncbi:MAG: acyltransferase family protein, partial [Acidimicrobiales bacterium]
MRGTPVRRPAAVGAVPAVPRTRAAAPSSPPLAGPLTHQPGIDGLRGLAVVVVMAYHFRPDWLPGGFLGVDTFMVLSGFLITRLLLAERERTGRIGLRQFWGRRARRLLPALFLVLAGVAAISTAWLPGFQLRGLRGDAWATITYVANWHLVATGQSYVSVVGTPSPLRHMWSLAIEEQYYVVWPVVALACLSLRRHGRKLLAAACVLGATASAIAMIVTYQRADPSRAYYGTDTRAQTLLVGAGLAIALHGRRVPAVRWLSGLAMVALVGQAVMWATANPADGWLYHGGFLLYALTTALLVAVTLGTGLLARPFSWAPARAIGRVSYGLYLWHWPAVVFLTPVRTGFDGLALLVLRTAVTAAAAVASYLVVEQPIRRRRWPTPVVRTLGPASALALAGAFAVLALHSAPLPVYLRTGSPASATSGVAEIVRPKPNVTSPPAPALVGVAPAVLPEVAVIEGDSVAASLKDSLAAELARRGVLTVKSTVIGCGMITGSPLDPDGNPYRFGPACSGEIPGHQLEDVARYQPDLVLWLSSWEARSREINGVKAELGTPTGDKAILDLMRDAVRRLTLRGARVIVVTLPVPYDTATVIHAPSFIEGVPEMNALLRRLAAADPTHVGLVDLGLIACGRGPSCPHVRNGIELRSDGLHYREVGSALVAPPLADALLDPDQWRHQ